MCEKLKVCSKCKIEKPATVDHFPRDKNRKDGFYPQCKECRRKGEVKPKAKNGFKICNKCNKELPMNIDYFHKNKDRKDGFNSRCKECSGYSYTDTLTKIPKNNHKFCIKCDRELPSTSQYFPPDNNLKSGLRNVCRECGSDGHFMDDGYVPKVWWSIEDEKLLADVYPYHLNSELIELYFPNKTEKDLSDKVYIMNKEKGYNIAKSKETVDRRYEIHSEMMSGENSPLYGVPKTDEHRRKLSESRRGRFIGENSYWFGRKRSPENRLKISKVKTELGLWKGKNNPRYINPLKKEKNGMWKGGISELHVYLRRFIKPWKDDSMKQCNYKCVITDGAFNNIHHLFNFSYILAKTMEIVDLPVHDEINKYSDDEMKRIEDTCLKLHYDLGLGVCLRKDIHKLFHDLYGYTNNTPEQFKEFKLRYRLGEFEEMSSKVGEGIV